MTDEQRKIENFVCSFNTPMGETREKFLHGKCYWFARILQERFSAWFPTEIMYNQVANHFCCHIETAAGHFYADASGVFATGQPDGWVLWKDYITMEPLDAARVYRDCIWYLDEDEWEELPQSFRDVPWGLGKSALTERYYSQEDCQE